MPRKRQVRDPIRAHEREAVAARRVGEESKCACGEARPLALIPGSEPTTCAECDRKGKDQSILDLHHVAGKRNSPLVIPVPVNDHRALLSAQQYDWPKQTLQNPRGDHKRRLAALVRGYFDVSAYLQEFGDRLRDEILAQVEAVLESDGDSSDTPQEQP